MNEDLFDIKCLNEMENKNPIKNKKKTINTKNIIHINVEKKHKKKQNMTGMELFMISGLIFIGILGIIKIILIIMGW